MLARLPERLRLLGVAAVVVGSVAWTAPEPGASPTASSTRSAAFAPPTSWHPTATPDRIVLTLSNDPATTLDVNWRTDISVTECTLEYTVAAPGPSFTDSVEAVAADTALFTSGAGDCHRHHVHLSGLRPATKYVYRVGREGAWSEWLHLRTASDRPEPFRFIYFGDAQNDIRSHWSRVLREAALDAPDAAFLLHAGDLVDSANSDAQWGEWFGAGGWLNAMVPSIATPGNHEYTGAGLSSHWRPQFAFPENGPEGTPELAETVYWLDYQGVRFVSLNTSRDLDAQLQWLPSVLSGHGQRWTIAFFHAPVFSAAKGRDNPRLRETLKPLFDEHGVDLVLQGHDHSYLRTGLRTPINLAEGASVRSGNTVYVVSVSGPKMYTVEGRDFAPAVLSGRQLYQVIDVDGDRLRYRAHLANGELFDAFTLTKGDDGLNRLQEQGAADDSGER